ncbi:MAG: TonB family protein [Pseudomonadota bacterium]
MIDRFKTQIMFLHPEPAVMEPCARQLGSEFSVHMAASGTEALTTLGITPIDIIVSAHDLPGMSGHEALKEAKKRSPETAGILLASPHMSDDDCAALVDLKHLDKILRAQSSAEDVVAAIHQTLNPSAEFDLPEPLNDVTATIANERLTQTGTYRNPALSSSGGFSATQEIPVIEPGLGQPEQVSASAISEVEIVVLTNDSSFLKTIRAATGTSHVVNHAPNLQEAVDIVREGRSGVLITDAAVAVKDVETITSQLRKHMPSLVTIVAGRREDGEKMMGLISDGLVYRFLLKPISPGRSRLAIEASAKKHLTLVSTDVPLSPKEVQAKMTETGIIKGVTFDSGLFRTTDVRESGISAPDIDENDMEPGLLGRIAGLPPIVLAVIAIVIAGGVFLLSRGGDDSNGSAVVVQSQAAQSTTAPATPVDPAQAARDAIASGDLASREGRLVTPGDDNAVMHYARAATLQPDNAVARARLDAVLQQVFAQVETNLLRDNLPDARDALTSLNQHVPGHQRLAFLNRELAKETARRELGLIEQAINAGNTTNARERLNALRASGTVDGQLLAPLQARIDSAASAATAPPEPSTAQTDTAALLTLANQRVASGQLIAPQSDSARDYYQAVLDVDPSNVTAQQGMTFIASMLLSEVRTDIARGDALAARRTLRAAEASGADPEEISVLRAQIASMLNPQALSAPRPTQATPRAASQTPAAVTQDIVDTPPEPPAAIQSGVSTVDTPVAEALAVEAEAETETTTDEGEFALIQTNRPPPRYPRSAQRRGQQGWVDVEFIVGADGTTRDVIAVDSQPGSVFDKSAIDAVTQWRYEPLATENPNAFTRARVRLEFNLTD